MFLKIHDDISYKKFPPLVVRGWGLDPERKPKTICFDIRPLHDKFAK
jgi:hypothetical protein